MVSFESAFFDRTQPMPEGLLPILLIIAAVIVYALAKVLQNIRKSDAQWEQVDKSKLKEWDDDD
jgi:hypothetical protein